MSNASTYAFKLIQSFEERLDRIEVLLARLADAKDDRETAVELSKEIKEKTAQLKDAIVKP